MVIVTRELWIVRLSTELRNVFSWNHESSILVIKLSFVLSIYQDDEVKTRKPSIVTLKFPVVLGHPCEQIKGIGSFFYSSGSPEDKVPPWTSINGRNKFNVEGFPLFPFRWLLSNVNRTLQIKKSHRPIPGLLGIGRPYLSVSEKTLWYIRYFYGNKRHRLVYFSQLFVTRYSGRSLCLLEELSPMNFSWWSGSSKERFWVS